MTSADTMAMLERRRIEAAILKHVYEALKESHGREVAAKTVAESCRRSAIEQAQKLAAEVGGKTSMQTFIDRQAQWRLGDALTIEVLEKSDSVYNYNVTRCRYSEMYREMGLGEIGHLLSCERDGAFCEGYDKRLQLKRTQTLMEGASHCDFRYTLDEGAGGTG